MKKIQKDALAHYDRMIAWAEKQDHTYPKSGMHTDIGEHWGQNYCSYCQANDICGVCTLSAGTDGCCDGLWGEMDRSTTWEKWVKNAKLVREYIRVNG